jgi:predicted oxidoreductase
MADPYQVRTLGDSALRVGPIAYGCWRFAGTEVPDARHKIEAALGAGMNLVDTADIYGFTGVVQEGFGHAEELLGLVLAEAPDLRDRMVLATKGGIRPPVPYDQDRRYLTAACEASLRRLGVDHVDLYQVHRPDVLTHPADLAATLDDLVDRGLTRHVGVSNFPVAHTEALRAHLRHPLVTTQPEFSAAHPAPIEDGTLDLCTRVGLTPLAWSPLAGGSLVLDDEVPPDSPVARLRPVLDRLAEVHNVTRGAVALAWVMAHPAGAVPIIGTQQPARIVELARAAEVRLDRSEWYEVLVAARGERLP